MCCIDKRKVEIMCREDEERGSEREGGCGRRGMFQHRSALAGPLREFSLYAAGPPDIYKVAEPIIVKCSAAFVPHSCVLTVWPDPNFRRNRQGRFTWLNKPMSAVRYR